MSRKKGHQLPELLQSFGHRLKKYQVDERPRVYFLVRRGRVVYVGKTQHLTKRLLAHFRDKAFDSVYYVDVDDDDLEHVEREMISHLKPDHNQVNLGTMHSEEPYFRPFPLDRAKNYFAPPKQSQHAPRPRVTTEELAADFQTAWDRWERDQKFSRGEDQHGET